MRRSAHLNLSDWLGKSRTARGLVAPGSAALTSPSSQPFLRFLTGAPSIIEAHLLQQGHVPRPRPSLKPNRFLHALLPKSSATNSSTTNGHIWPLCCGACDGLCAGSVDNANWKGWHESKNFGRKTGRALGGEPPQKITNNDAPDTPVRLASAKQPCGTVRTPMLWRRARGPERVLGLAFQLEKLSSTKIHWWQHCV